MYVIIEEKSWTDGVESMWLPQEVLKMANAKCSDFCELDNKICVKS
jgi:hypothetical protein